MTAVGETMKRIIILALLAFCATTATGCFSLVDWEHNNNHLKVWNKELDDMHRDIDYFFFDYDWNDPSQDLNFETDNT